MADVNGGHNAPRGGRIDGNGGNGRGDGNGNGRDDPRAVLFKTAHRLAQAHRKARPASPRMGRLSMRGHVSARSSFPARDFS